MASIKRLFATLLFLAIAALAIGQKAPSSFQSGGYSFPYVSMEQLIRYCDMDSAAYDSLMRSMDFNLEENIYTKGNLDKSKMVFGKSRLFGTSIVWVSHDKGTSLIERLLEKFSQPAEISVSDGFSFMYKKYVITVKSSQSDLNYEEINIIDKSNYLKNQEH